MSDTSSTGKTCPKCGARILVVCLWCRPEIGIPPQTAGQDFLIKYGYMMPMYVPLASPFVHFGPEDIQRQFDEDKVDDLIDEVNPAHDLMKWSRVPPKAE